MPGVRLFFSFCIAVSILSDVGGPVSMVALGTALAASVCRRMSRVGGGGGGIIKLFHEVFLPSVQLFARFVKLVSIFARYRGGVERMSCQRERERERE